MPDTASQHRARVFVNHAAFDQELADLVVRALSRALRLPPSTIFCSSLDRHGIPTGQDFVSHIRQQLDHTRVVVPLVTPAYLDSQFCMWELGAAWVREVPVHPMVETSLSFDELPVLLRARQVRRIDAGALNELVTTVADVCEAELDWPAWESELNSLLPEIERVLLHAPQRWNATEAAQVRRRARVGDACAQIHSIHHELRDITHLILRFGPNAREQDDYWRALRSVANNICAVFTASTQAECRITIKESVIVGGSPIVGEDPIMGVKDLTRSPMVMGDRKLVDLVDENTDFQVIWRGNERYYICNDIRAAQDRGVYENSHTRPDGTVPYNSTIVWPIRKVLDDSDGTRPDMIGFLCVDTAATGAFDEVDIQLGASFADALYALRPTIPMLDD